jgi:hypothetical protein
VGGLPYSHGFRRGDGARRTQVAGEISQSRRRAPKLLQQTSTTSVARRSEEEGGSLSVKYSAGPTRRRRGRRSSNTSLLAPTADQGRGPLRVPPSRQSSMPPRLAKSGGWAVGLRTRGVAPKSPRPAGRSERSWGQTRRKPVAGRRLPSTMDGQPQLRAATAPLHATAAEKTPPNLLDGMHPPSLSSPCHHGQPEQEKKDEESRRRSSLFRRRWTPSSDSASTDEARER